MFKDIIQRLIDKNITISFAESCTGGLLASTLTKVPGVSSIFKGSFVTYSDEYKIRFLNVREETINKYGVVSKEVAREMVTGLNEITKTNISVSVTGNAGPTKGDPSEPVGRIYYGISYNGVVNTYELNLNGNREEIIEEAVKNIYLMIDSII